MMTDEIQNPKVQRDGPNAQAALLLQMLSEYTDKIRFSRAALDQWRSRLLLHSLVAVSLGYAGVLAAYFFWRDHSNFRWFAPPSVIIAAVAISYLAWIFATSSRRLKSARDEIDIQMTSLARLVRRASQIHEHTSLGFSEQLMLDVKLGEAESLLRERSWRDRSREDA